MSDELEFDLSHDEDRSLDKKLIYTVSQLSSEIKYLLEDSYPGVWIAGELSNFKLYSSGHMYFDIKDENAQINAVMFQNANAALNFEPENGMQVMIYGRVSSYAKRGGYQIIVNHMEQSGKGVLFEAFEKLKLKLKDEGMFDADIKQKIPDLVNKIGVITSKDGAALHDILRVLDTLNANAEVLIYPVRVQGKEAETEIPQAIRYMNANYKELDVLLVGRGGGSIEDLWAFNTEPVARAIFDSKIPIISCVGHETDFTIADFVADLRAPTPSAAAETAVRGTSDLKRRFADMKEALFDNMNFTLENLESKLDILSSTRAFTKPHLIYEDKISYIDELDERLRQSAKRLLETKNEKIGNMMHKLDLVSPLSVLKRGYSICRDKNKKVVKDSVDVKTGDKLEIKLARGSLKANIEVRNDE